MPCATANLLAMPEVDSISTSMTDVTEGKSAMDSPPMPDQAQPATMFYDRRGIPIHSGDLLRALHFIGARRKRYYLYHVAVNRDGHWWLVPTGHLDPSRVSGGGDCWLTEESAACRDIIDGTDPGGLSFERRPRLSGSPGRTAIQR